MLRDQAKPTQNQYAQQEKLKIQSQRADQGISASSIVFEGLLKSQLADSEEHLQALKLPNAQKRLKAIVELKKAISKKLTESLSADQARDLFEPLTVLIRQLLTDESAEVYLEALSLLKFVTGSLANILSSLDLHLMLGSFIGIIV